MIAAFDPDHVPEAEFLSAVLGYFDDPSVGYVQAAQAYYNQAASFIARGRRRRPTSTTPRSR